MTAPMTPIRQLLPPIGGLPPAAPGAGCPPQRGRMSRLPAEEALPPAPASALAPVEPPSIEQPEIGQTIPAGNPCPACGTLRDYWVYNPFVRQSRNGWVMHTSRICACPESDPYRPSAEPPRRTTLSQSWLDHEFGQAAVRGQTFLTFNAQAQPRLRPALAAAQQWARLYQHSPVAAGRAPASSEHEWRGQNRGIYLAGPAAIGKGHLLNALVNVARALGVPALSLSQGRLFDRVLTPDRETPEERDERLQRRQVLRRVPVLALRSLFIAPMTLAELKELDLLLECREERGLITHVAAAYGPKLIKTRATAHPELHQSIAARLSRLTLPPLVIPGDTDPYAPDQAFRRSGAQVRQRQRRARQCRFLWSEHLNTRTPEHLNARTPERLNA